MEVARKFSPVIPVIIPCRLLEVRRIEAVIGGCRKQASRTRGKAMGSAVQGAVGSALQVSARSQAGQQQ